MRLHIFLILLIISLSACSSQESIAPTVIEQKISDKGVTLSPKSFNAEDFSSFFVKAKEAGDYVSWSGNWNELSNKESSGAAVVSSLASNYGYIPVILATVSDTNEIGSLSEQYKISAVAFAERYKPEYMGFGIEINTLYEESPEEFEKFVVLYSEVYTAVKEVSPNTKIFTIYQLEKMKGLHSGLFGGVISTAEWELLGKFNNDVIAFTTYPGIIYTDPSDIPEDYYSDIALHTDKNIIFTEVGWTSSSSIEGWESSEEEQAKFVERFFSLTDDLPVKFVLWSFLYDQDVSEPFTNMGLFDKEGNAKQAWETWKLQ